MPGNASLDGKKYVGIWTLRFFISLFVTIGIIAAHPDINVPCGVIFVTMGLTILFYMVHQDRSWVGALQIVAVFTLVFRYWLEWMAASPYLAPLAGVAALVVSTIMASSLGLWWIIVSKGPRNFFIWRIWAALTWSLVEMSREIWFCGFPWYPLGMSFLNFTPNLFAWLSPFGASAFLVWMALEMVYASTWWRKIIGLICGFLMVYGATRYEPHLERQIEVQAALVDSSLPVHHFHTSCSSDQIVNYLHATLPQIKPRTGASRWVVLPEGLFPDAGSYFCLLSREKADSILPLHLAKMFQGYLIMGVEDDWNDAGLVTNSLWVFSPSGHRIFSYAKKQLIPFAEYFPLSDWPMVGPMLKNLSRSYGILDPLDHGTQAGMININDLKVALSICFEETFLAQLLDLRRGGAQLWISSSNDGWYPQSTLKDEHALHARMLSATLGIPLLRSCQLGLSGVIDGNGQWQEVKKIHEKYPVSWRIFDGKLSCYTTPFSVFGYWILGVPWVVSTLWLFCALRRMRSRC